MHTGRAIHSKLFTHVVLASPFKFGFSPEDYSGGYAKQRRNLHHHVQIDVINDDSGVFSPKPLVTEEHMSYSFDNTTPVDDQEELFDLSKFIIKVAEEEKNYGSSYTQNPQQQKKSEQRQQHQTVFSNKQTINDAARELQKTLGQIEFELGVKAAGLGDYTQSVSHFKLATAHEHSGATFNLGICFEQGIGIKQDMNLAMECYDAASRLGHPKAMYNLGVFYASGLGGLRKNKKLARRCFEAAAQLGVIEAKTALGFTIFPQEDTVHPEVLALSPVDCAINCMNPILVS